MMADKRDIAAKIKWFRGRADEEVHVAAEGMKNPITRVTMLRMAETYERIANSLEMVVRSRKRIDVG